jgi:glycosyltransferase involved in cell wall biosynthesis
MSKIVLVANTDWYLYNFRLAFARRLRALGNEVILVTPPGNFCSQFTQEGFRWISWRLERRAISPWKELRAIWLLYQIYKQENPKLVHHHTIKVVLYGSYAAWFAQIPGIVNSIAGLGYVFLESDFLSRLIKGLITPFYKQIHKLQLCLHVFENQPDRQYFLESGFTTISQSWLIESVGVNPEKFFHVPEMEGPPIVLFAGRMLWDKGVSIFIEAARLLKSKVNARFVLAGQPDPGNPATVTETQLRDWQTEGVVEWWGWQPNMQDVFARSHIVTLPTSYGEGVPTVLIEGAACGRPLVGSDIPGCRAVIVPGKNGFLVPENDPKALAEAVEGLILNPDLRRTMGNQGRRIFLDKFTDDKVNSALIDVYNYLHSNI